MKLYKVVWSNGDEMYVKASSKAKARVLARLKHGPTAAIIRHCERYG